MIILIALGLLTSCKQGGGKTEGDATQPMESGLIQVTTRQFEANGMALGSPEMKTFPEVIRVSGTIDVPPENRVVISAIYGGYVKKTSLLEGDQVKKGQVLLTLENPEFLTLQQQYLEISEQIPYLKSEFERQETLYAEQISSQKVFLKAQSDYKTALARKGSLEEQLTMLGMDPGKVATGSIRSEIAIRSPISGSVHRINIRRGAYVSQATEIMEIVNTEHIHLELIVFEKDVSRIRKGQGIRFRIPELSDQVHQGSVYLIGSIVDENRTVKVHGHVDEEALEQLMVGMFVQADILIPPDSAMDRQIPGEWALPETAFDITAEGTYILLLEAATDNGYAFRKVQVQTGASSGGYTALAGPGVPGETDRILVRGVEMLAQQ